MQLGWVDYSNKERNKVMDVLRQLDVPGAVDELGIGVIRDAFANYFFPGTSTIQTRAKYFLIVPYLLKELGDAPGINDANQLLQQLTGEEKNSAIALINHCRSNNIRPNGIIGVDSLPNKWVVRGPADIYWNGIQTYGIFSRNDMSIRSYFQTAIAQSRVKSSREYGKMEKDDESDDQDAGALNGLFHWDLGSLYTDNWRDNLSINLTLDEALFLEHKIVSTHSDSLLSIILANKIDVMKFGSFEQLTNYLNNIGILSDDLSDTIKLANDFNRLYMLATTRYNIMYSLGENQEALTNWKMFSKNLRYYSSVDLDAIDRKFHIKNRRLMIFLRNLKNAFQNESIDEADELIRIQEKSIKTKSRAKLYSDINTRRINEWIGGFLLDYRFHSAKNIINDIQIAENQDA